MYAYVKFYKTIIKGTPKIGLQTPGFRKIEIEAAVEPHRIGKRGRGRNWKKRLQKIFFHRAPLPETSKCLKWKGYHTTMTRIP